MIDKTQLQSEAAALGLQLSDAQLDQFDRLAQALVDRNRVMNLTAITEPSEIVTRHFADSLTVAAAVPLQEAAAVLDLGTGAGFPGLPLMILRPDLQMTLLDSTAKKLAYVAETADALGLRAQTLHQRAEIAGRDPAFRAQFDLVCSRAVAPLPVLCEYALPLLRIGGRLVAMKSVRAAEELAQAKDAIRLLGGAVAGVSSFTLADGSSRVLILIEKKSQTPAKYPRSGTQIAKKPL
ncbi:MAG: 16S rRNA (guanine(527)-N(7))-methyltransferase RsmG [Clostridia bacterium]|nr:16S rRNA (guanine(527)-N(7))-methyltransferase RsmG [Clostridia bacterium]